MSRSLIRCWRWAPTISSGLPGALSHLELRLEDEAQARFYRALSSFSRLIVFDKRGTGLSDRAAGIPDLETRMDDIRAVMDAAGSEAAAVCGVSEGGPMALLFAATYPERVRALVTTARCRGSSAGRTSLGGAEARVLGRGRGGGASVGNGGARA